MVNEEILGGLKAALEKGQQLREAMLSFYNSGYNKEEIEEAARALIQIETEKRKERHELINRQMKHLKKTGLNNKSLTPSPEYSVNPQALMPLEPGQQYQTVQKVSSYEEKKKINIKIIIWAIFLTMALAGLIFVFLFRNEIVNFFNELS